MDLLIDFMYVYWSHANLFDFKKAALNLQLYFCPGEPLFCFSFDLCFCFLCSEEVVLSVGFKDTEKWKQGEFPLGNHC